MKVSEKLKAVLAKLEESARRSQPRKPRPSVLYHVYERGPGGQPIATGETVVWMPRHAG